MEAIYRQTLVQISPSAPPLPLILGRGFDARGVGPRPAPKPRARTATPSQLISAPFLGYRFGRGSLRRPRADLCESLFITKHYIVIVESIQIRLGKAELAELSDLQDEFKRSRSEVTRRALAEGIRVLKTDVALNRYAREEITLERAAEFAGVSIAQMADAASARGISYFRYSPEELDNDLRTLRRARR